MKGSRWKRNGGDISSSVCFCLFVYLSVFCVCSGSMTWTPTWHGRRGAPLAETTSRIQPTKGGHTNAAARLHRAALHSRHSD